MEAFGWLPAASAPPSVSIAIKSAAAIARWTIALKMLDPCAFNVTDPRPHPCVHYECEAMTWAGAGPSYLRSRGEWVFLAPGLDKVPVSFGTYGQKSSF
jgi:hypothetical protein